MSIRVWLVTIPEVPGPDLRHGSEASAKREVRNAHKKGFTGAYARSLLVHVVA